MKALEIHKLERNNNQIYPLEMTIKSITMKDEKKQPPLLYNLAEWCLSGVPWDESSWYRAAA